ncbi:MAG: imidazolonepropionase [Deltaproteobacteria bacterium]|nr:MAG: imidazolonepropionase [Deltaproteobacteria bacterium]
MKHYSNISQVLSLESANSKDGRNLEPSDLSVLNNASIVFDNEKILWIGKTTELPDIYQSVETTDLTGHCVTPEVVDSHTHLIFGGDRAKEYSMRLNGADYIDIAKAGGGILNTMNGTNSLDKHELLSISRERVERLHSYGIGSIEIKTGYGLNFEKEYELSHIVKELKDQYKGKVQIINTFMAAHAVPKNYESSSQYMNEVVIPLLEKLASEKVIDCADIFHESGYFDSSDTKLLFEKCIELNIPFKSHADEFNDNKGAKLAAEMGALSTDHLLCTTQDGIEALSKSKTVATLLPGTGYFLGKPQANARALLNAGVKVSIASDYNPGSCHWDNLLQIASLAAPNLGFNQTQLWAAITLNAAHALGLTDQGAIVRGLKPRFSIFKVPTIDHITYHWGRNFAVTL